MRYGVPCQGSKNGLARELVSLLPSGRRFVDLFAGGCAMTHAALLSGKWRQCLANDAHGFGVSLFTDAIAGRCRGRWREWIGRDGFDRRKRTEPLVALCWSFSYNGRDYLYSRADEADMKAAHLATADGRRPPGRIPESFQRTAALERLTELRTIADARLSTSRESYADYRHRPGDIVYCDPPYHGTRGFMESERGHATDFDSAAFFGWVMSRPFPVFVSEYAAPDGMAEIWRREKWQGMSTGGWTKKATERLFVQAQFAERWRTWRY